MTFNYDMYDSDARHAVTAAMNEARSRNHARYNLEHILLGLSKPESPVSALLQEHGMTYENLDMYMKVRNPRRSVKIGSVQAGPYVEDLLTDVQQRIKNSSKRYASCIHILYSTLRLLNEDDCIAAKLCRDLHINMTALFREVTTLIKAELIRDIIAQNHTSAETLATAVVRVVDDSQFNQVLTLIKK